VIHHWLDRPPEDQGDLSSHRFIVVDGTFVYRRRVCAVVVMDGLSNAVITGIYGIKEGERSMVDVCRDLKRRGLNPIAATIDGNPQLHRMLRTVWPAIVIQRCLVHIQWQGQRWCRAKPKTPEGQSLRELFARVTQIATERDRRRFLADLNAWEAQYGQRVEQASPRAWVARDLRAARSMLLKAFPNMFWYLKYPNIPTTTNSAEGCFGWLKQRYAQHRGLARHRRINYFRWYFALQKHSQKTPRLLH
jgi:hypothetical protein